MADDGRKCEDTSGDTAPGHEVITPRHDGMTDEQLHQVPYRDKVHLYYSPGKIILFILCSVDTEVDTKKIRHERDYVRVVIMRQ